MSRQRNASLVVCVDDDTRILNALRRCLKSRELEIMTTVLPHEALAWVTEHDVSLIIADLYMREMNGISLLEEVRRRRPSTGRMALTAHPAFLSVLEQRTPDLNGMFTKPWDSRELRGSVLRVVAGRGNGQSSKSRERRRV